MRYHALVALLLQTLTPLAMATAQGGGYYAGVNQSNRAALRSTLHDVIDDHLWFPYTSSATDTWDILEQADQDPSNSGRVLDVNKNASYAKQGGGNSFYNRDHIWPKSFGFPSLNSSNYPYTDCHALFLSDSTYNNLRGNKPYAACSASCTERVTLANNGQGGGAGVYPGNSNWSTNNGVWGAWQQWHGRCGDVARAILYLDVRYEGGQHGVTGKAEPDLIVTDNVSLLATTSQNVGVAHYGYLTVLLAWHHADPVDAMERRRNDVVFSYQGNRNPFVDHPEWVDCLFGSLVSPAETIRAGVPANPVALLPGATRPWVGSVWDPVIDHTTFMAAASTDVLAVTAVPSNLPSPWGTLLCDFTTPALIVAAPAGQPLQLPIAPKCALAGSMFYAQGASIDAAGQLRMTNALDVVIGFQ